MQELHYTVGWSPVTAFDSEEEGTHQYRITVFRIQKLHWLPIFILIGSVYQLAKDAYGFEKYSGEIDIG